MKDTPELRFIQKIQLCLLTLAGVQDVMILTYSVSSWPQFKTCIGVYLIIVLLAGSWADAGDFGVYTVNHAISAWTLLNLHELFPSAFTDGTLNLPESGNDVHDILDEVDYGSRFVRGMLPKTNGQSNGELASHKAHNHAWSAFTITIESENAQNRAGTRTFTVILRFSATSVISHSVILCQVLPWGLLLLQPSPWLE